MKKIKILLNIVLVIALLILCDLYIYKHDQKVYEGTRLLSTLLDVTDVKLVNNTGKVGYLTYGPYVALEAGEYNVKVYYNADVSDNTVEVFSGRLGKSFYKEELESKEDIKTISLNLLQDVTDMEIRIVYMGVGKLQVDKIVISQPLAKSVYMMNLVVIFLYIFFEFKGKYILTNIAKKINGADEKRIVCIVVLLYGFNVMLRFFVANFNKAAIIEPDEWRYMKWAISFVNDGTISINNITKMDSPLLYSLYISLAYLFPGKLTQITNIAFLNSIALCSTLFPTYLLTRKWISSNTLRVIVVFLVALLPDMVMSITFMAENLYIPLCVWFFYFFDEYLTKWLKKGWMEFVLAIGCVLLYATKDIALFFVIVIVLILTIISFMNVEEQGLKKCIRPLSFLAFFIVFFVLYKYVIVKYILIDYSKVSAGGVKFSWRFNTWYDFIYYFYLNVLANVNTFVAFTYFPIAIPILLFPVLTKEDKIRALFGLLAQVLAIGVISYLVSLNEDYGNLDVRQHMRYYSAILVWDLVLLVRLYEKYILNNKLKEISRVWIVGFTTFASLTIFSVFHLYKKGIVDNTLLCLYEWLAENGTVIYGEYGKFNVLYSEVMTKIALTLFVVIFTVLIFRKQKEKIFLIGYLIVAVFVFSTTSLIASQKLRTIYGAYFNVDTVREVEVLDDYFCEKDVNILIITKNYDKSLNTYFHQNAYWVSENHITSRFSETSMIDFTKDTLGSQYPGDIYYNLKNIDYLILGGNVFMQITNGERLQLEGLEYYQLYRIQDTELHFNCITTGSN